MCSLTKSLKIATLSSNIIKNHFYWIFLRATCYNYHTFSQNQIFFNSENNHNALLNPKWLQYNSVRFKKKKAAVEPKSAPYEEDEENEDEQADDSVVGKNIENRTMTINFMRIDAVMKSGLNVSRSRLEKAFFENRFRLNGRKVLKKSANVQIGDEIDLIKEVSKDNKDFLVVSRIEIVSVKPNENKDALLVKIRRTKSLLVENYQDDPWKLSSED